MSFSHAELGEHIRTAREARSLSQKELADLAGIGKTAMFDLEHGNPGVRLNTLLAVLHELKMDLKLIPPETEPLSSPAPATETLPSHLL